MDYNIPESRPLNYFKNTFIKQITVNEFYFAKLKSN